MMGIGIAEIFMLQKFIVFWGEVYVPKERLNEP